MPALGREWNGLKCIDSAWPAVVCKAAAEHAARALAAYAAEAECLRGRLVKLEAAASSSQASVPGTPVSISGILRSASRSLLRHRSSLSPTAAAAAQVHFVSPPPCKPLINPLQVPEPWVSMIQLDASSDVFR